MQELDRSGWCAHSACRTQAYLIVLTRMHVRTPQGRRSTIIIDCQRSGSPRLAVWAVLIALHSGGKTKSISGDGFIAVLGQRLRKQGSDGA